MSRRDRTPWVNENTRLDEADEWIDDQRESTFGGTRFTLMPAGPAHTQEDLIAYLPQHGDCLSRPTWATRLWIKNHRASIQP